jgi:hypothetical protein
MAAYVKKKEPSVAVSGDPVHAKEIREHALT